MSNFFQKFKNALSLSTNKISSGIDNIFFKKKLDTQTLNELEELLISSDVSAKVSSDIITKLQNQKFDKEITGTDIKLALSNIITDILLPINKPLTLNDNELNVILICGVNGSGKTTTIGKLSQYFTKQGKKVAIAACDTFRAAAMEQLQTWANRSSAIFYSGEEKQEPASVAYNAVLQAKKEQVDILFVDTAGRLQNYKNLMNELTKITKVINKAEVGSLKHSLLVLDATIGQNIYSQVEEFKQAANVNGLIITKLDGTAKAGVIIGVTQKYQLPIYYIGIGEKENAIEEFDALAFSKNLVGIEYRP